jgi:hypothetical protein
MEWGRITATNSYIFQKFFRLLAFLKVDINIFSVKVGMVLFQRLTHTARFIFGKRRVFCRNVDILGAESVYHFLRFAKLPTDTGQIAAL